MSNSQGRSAEMFGRLWREPEVLNYIETLLAECELVSDVLLIQKLCYKLSITVKGFSGKVEYMIEQARFRCSRAQILADRQAEFEEKLQTYQQSKAEFALMNFEELAIRGPIVPTTQPPTAE